MSKIKQNQIDPIDYGQLHEIDFLDENIDFEKNLQNDYSIYDSMKNEINNHHDQHKKNFNSDDNFSGLDTIIQDIKNKVESNKKELLKLRNSDLHILDQKKPFSSIEYEELEEFQNMFLDSLDIHTNQNDDFNLEDLEYLDNLDFSNLQTNSLYPGLHEKSFDHKTQIIDTDLSKTIKKDHKGMDILDPETDLFRLRELIQEIQKLSVKDFNFLKKEIEKMPFKD